jgi:hypothetical protein
MLRWLVVSVSVLSVVNCAYQPRHVDAERTQTPAPAEVKAAANLDASYVSEVKFSKNESALGTQDQEVLRQLVTDARAAGKIDEIKVAVWADHAYPAKQKRLDSKERELASKRAKAIEEYLDSLDAGDVDVYNMAERPNAMEKLLNTSDARVKRALESAGLTGDKGGVTTKASRAVVMVVLDE